MGRHTGMLLVMEIDCVLQSITITASCIKRVSTPIRVRKLEIGSASSLLAVNNLMRDDAINAISVPVLYPRPPLYWPLRHRWSRFQPDLQATLLDPCRTPLLFRFGRSLKATYLFVRRLHTQTSHKPPVRTKRGRHTSPLGSRQCRDY